MDGSIKNEEKELDVKAPKTKKSKKNITLMKDTVKSLRYHKNIQE